jgi:hypothetical protein
MRADPQTHKEEGHTDSDNGDEDDDSIRRLNLTLDVSIQGRKKEETDNTIPSIRV